MNTTPFSPGSSWLIRTVTHYWTGRVRETVGGFLVLDKSAWIAETGRFYQATTIEALQEVDPCGDGIVVSLASIVDARPWPGDLPSEPK